MRRLLLALLLCVPLGAHAAAVTHEIATADTGATPNTSGAFTPAVGDLLVVGVCVSSATDATAPLTSSVGGFTFTQVEAAPHTSSSHMLYVYVADALVSSASSQTVTWTETADAGNGTVIMVAAISGITLDGLDAIAQSAEETGAAGTTPDPTFAGAVTTTNPTLGFLCNISNPAGVTEPSGWTEAADTGFATPDQGAEYVYRNSGFTGTQISWGSNYGTTGASIIVEIDADAGGGGGSAGVVSFVAGSSDGGANVTSVTPTEPTGTAQNDLVVAFCVRAENVDDGSWSDPADFTQITVKNETLGADDGEMYLGYKVRGASAGSGYAFTYSGSVGALTCALTSWRDIDTGTPFDVTYSEGSHYNSNQNAVTTAAQPITTVTDGAMVVLLQMFTSELDSGAPPTGYTERVAFPTVTVNNSRHIYIASKSKTTAGAETPSVWGHVDSNTNADGRNFTIAIRPSSSGGGGGITITDVDTDEAVTTTQTNVVITGTAFGATQGGGSVRLNLGANSKLLSVDSWANTSIQVDISGAGMGVSGGLPYGAVTLRVTNNAADFADEAVTITAPSGTIFANLSGGIVDLAFDGHGNANRLFGDPDDLQTTSQVGIRNASGCTASTDITINPDGSAAADEDCVSFDWDFTFGGTYLGTVATVEWAGCPVTFAADDFEDLVFQDDLAIPTLDLSQFFDACDEAIDTFGMRLLSSTSDSGTDINGTVNGATWVVDDASVLLDDVGSYVQCASGDPVRLIWANPVTNELGVSAPRSCTNNDQVNLRTTSSTSVTGLSLNGSTGELTGTPTSAGVTGPIVFRATSTSGVNADTP